MITNEEVSDFSKLLNSLNLIGLSSVLVIAFVLQIGLSELPCPLCLMQRIGIMAMCFGFLLNVHYQIRVGHYALTMLAAIFTGIAAARQVVMNALPPHGYGYPIFGIHLYTWTALLSLAVVIYTCIIMSIPGQYQNAKNGDTPLEAKSKWIRALSHFAFGLLLLILVGNMVSVYLECGLVECHGDFLAYKVHI